MPDFVAATLMVLPRDNSALRSSFLRNSSRIVDSGCVCVERLIKVELSWVGWKVVEEEMSEGRAQTNKACGASLSAIAVPSVHVAWRIGTCVSGVSYAFTCCMRELVGNTAVREKRYEMHFKLTVPLFCCI